MNDRATPGYFSDFVHRLRTGIFWIAAQLLSIAVLLFAGLAWTRMPDKYAWQVLLSMLIPLLLVAGFLVLQAGTMRKFFGSAERRIPFATGAITLAAWIALIWIVWVILDWCSNQVWMWAAYLNSRASAPGRARVFTFEHLRLWLNQLFWICRWILIPGKVIPYAMATAEWGWRLPMGKIIRLLLNWRWWPAAIAAALIGVALPGHFFSGLPHGAVSHQVWSVILKMIGAYLLVVISWVLLLAWCTVLLARQTEPAADALDQELFHLFFKSRFWIAALAGWVLVPALISFILPHLLSNLRSQNWIAVPAVIIMIALVVAIQTGLMRALINDDGKRVRFIWGALCMLVWVVPAVAIAFLVDLYHAPLSLQIASWIVVPAVLIPIGAASTTHALRLPWRRILKVECNWRWWMGVLVAVIVGSVLPDLIHPSVSSTVDTVREEIPELRRIIANLLAFCSWIFLMGWVAVLWDAAAPHTEKSAGDAPHAIPVDSSLPLPDSSDSTGRNA